MNDVLVALIGEAYFVLICEDKTTNVYLGIAECSSQEQAFNICDALTEKHRLDEQFLSYGGSE
jgi:hypothetical protein